jgi:hypothetical protein
MNQGRKKLMKTRLISIFVCLLLIPFTFPAVESLKDNTLHQIVPIKTQISSAENWTEMQKLLASDDIPENIFGESVSLDGNTALIGADGYEDKGAAYVFSRTGNTWNQEAKLLASDGAVGDSFGYAVSLDGDTALIGAQGDDDNGNWSGSAYVFTRTGTIWTQQQKLLASDGATYDCFGCSVSLDGDTALIGSPLNEYGSGSAYVFTRTGTIWTQQVKLVALDSAHEDYFGWSVSLDGDTALIGAYGDDDNQEQSGSAYIFNRIDTIWAQEAKLLASDGVKGDFFGNSVSLDGDTALICACSDDDNGYDSGSAYVFTCVSSIWNQQTKLFPSDGAPEDYFGCSGSVNGDTVLVGAYWDDDNGDNSGSAYIFTRTDSIWVQQAKLLASDGAAHDVFGNSVSVDENIALIGVPFDDNEWDATGSARLFVKESGLPYLEINIIGGLGVNAVITNNGYANASGVEWQIHVKGGLLGLINKTTNGTTDILVGESKTVKTGLFFGLGSITITVKAADIEETVKGTQFFILTIIKK